MPDIDIQVSADLQEMFDLPACADVSLPKPSPLKVRLPGGGTLSAFSDLSKGLPTDCALTFSLLGQIGPFLASIECLVKLLGLVKPLIDVVKALPSLDLAKLATAVPQFIAKAEPVLECVVAFTPQGGLALFIRDLLCLIMKVLNCFLGQMKSVLRIMEETSVRIDIANASGNTELLQALRCAQDNAMTEAQHMAASMEALRVILDLAGDLMGLVGQPPIQLPSIGSQIDVSSLRQLVKDTQAVMVVLRAATDALGGCGQ
jgi:hypothetical protein